MNQPNSNGNTPTPTSDTPKKVRNVPTETPKGTYVLAVDCKNLYSRKRHTDPEAVKQECKRLANELGERVLVLQVVGVYDKRKKAKATEPTVKTEQDS